MVAVLQLGRFMAKSLDAYTIKRINVLTHEHKLKRCEVASRLGISRTAIRANLLPLNKWEENNRIARSS